MDAIKYIKTPRARCEHAGRQRGDETAPIRIWRYPQGLGEIGGPHHEHLEPWISPANLCDIQNSGRSFRHRPDRKPFRGTGGFECADRCLQLAGRTDLRKEHRIGATARRRLDVVARPGRACAIHPDHDLAASVSARRNRGHHLIAGHDLGIGRYGILQIHDEHVGVQRTGLLQRPRIGTGHVQRGAAQPDLVTHLAAACSVLCRPVAGGVGLAPIDAQTLYRVYQLGVLDLPAVGQGSQCCKRDVFRAHLEMRPEVGAGLAQSVAVRAKRHERPRNPARDAHR